MPGPGQYELKSQFEKKSIDEDDPDIDHPKVPFGSKLQVRNEFDIMIVLAQFYCCVTHVSGSSLLNIRLLPVLLIKTPALLWRALRGSVDWAKLLLAKHQHVSGRIDRLGCYQVLELFL